MTSVAHPSRRQPATEGWPNLDLENGRSIRYSDHMSTFCATTAPTHHPPGEAHAAPAALTPITTRVRPQRLPGRRSRQRLHHQQPNRRDLSPCRLAPTQNRASPFRPAQQLRPSVAKNTPGDTKRHATARLEGVGSLLPLAATNGVETPQWQKAPDTLNVTTLTKSSSCRSNQHAPCLPKTIGRHWQTRQSWQTWHAWIPCRRSAASSATKLANHSWPTRPSRPTRPTRKNQAFSFTPALNSPFAPIRVIRGQFPVFLPLTRFNSPPPVADSIPPLTLTP